MLVRVTQTTTLTRNSITPALSLTHTNTTLSHPARTYVLVRGVFARASRVVARTSRSLIRRAWGVVGSQKWLLTYHSSWVIRLTSVSPALYIAHWVAAIACSAAVLLS